MLPSSVPRRGIFVFRQNIAVVGTVLSRRLSVELDRRWLRHGAVAELVLGGTSIVDGVEIPEIVIEIEPPEENHGNTRSHLRLYDSRFVGGAPNTADFICCRITSVRWILAT